MIAPHSLRGLSVPVWQAQTPIGSTGADACSATFTTAFSDVRDLIGVVPIVIIVVLLAMVIRSRIM